MTCGEVSGARARGGFRDDRPQRDRTPARRLRAREEQDILDGLPQTVDALDHRRDDLAFPHPGRQARLENLQRPPQASQRVAHFVRHDGRELPELRQRLLFPQPRLGDLALRDVAADRQVLPRLAAVVEERHDGRVDPVERAVLGAIAQLAAPDAALRNRAPELADFVLRVIPGVDDAMILPDELLAGVLRNLAELVVDVGNRPARVGRGDDRRLIEGLAHLLEPARGIVDERRGFRG